MLTSTAIIGQRLEQPGHRRLVGLSAEGRPGGLEPPWQLRRPGMEQPEYVCQPRHSRAGPGHRQPAQVLGRLRPGEYQLDLHRLQAAGGAEQQCVRTQRTHTAGRSGGTLGQSAGVKFTWTELQPPRPPAARQPTGRVLARTTRWMPPPPNSPPAACPPRIRPLAGSPPLLSAAPHRSQHRTCRVFVCVRARSCGIARTSLATHCRAM